MGSLESAAERGTRPGRTLGIVTSIHPDFDARIWKHARAVAAAGWRVLLIAPWDPSGATIPDGIEIIPFARVQHRLKRPILIPARIAARLLPILRSCDLVHFHDIDILPWMSAVSTVKPVVYDVHEDYPEEMLVRDWVPDLLRQPLRLGVEVGQRLFSRPIRNIVLTQPLLDREFQGKGFRKITLPNYASLTLVDGVEENYLERSPTVIFIGTQHANNGSLLFLDIAERVKALRPEVRFLTVDRFTGDKFRTEVLGQVASRGLSNVELIPNVRPHELMRSLNRATIALSPNLRVKQQINGAHNKIYEFMAAALPQVASDLPHQVDVIGGSEAGILAKPEDPDTFAAAIVRLVDDRLLGLRLGKNGQRAFQERYSWESQMPKLLGYYETILTGR
jgi:glycosyltransferase involved in cell wall biosynthesis